MGINKNAQGNFNKGNQHLPDGQRNYQNSNERNQDNVRDDTRKNQYQDYDEKLTNDENFDINAPSGSTEEMDFRDRQENLDSGKTD